MAQRLREKRDRARLIFHQLVAWTPLARSLFLVAMPGAPSSVLVTTSKALVTRSTCS